MGYVPYTFLLFIRILFPFDKILHEILLFMRFIESMTQDGLRVLQLK